MEEDIDEVAPSELHSRSPIHGSLQSSINPDESNSEISRRWCVTPEQSEEKESLKAELRGHSEEELANKSIATRLKLLICKGWLILGQRWKKRWILGVAFLLAVALIWTLSGVATQIIFANLSFSKPYFLTYFSTSLMTLYMFGFIFFASWRKNDDPNYEPDFMALSSSDSNNSNKNDDSSHSSAFDTNALIRYEEKAKSISSFHEYSEESSSIGNSAGEYNYNTSSNMIRSTPKRLVINDEEGDYDESSVTASREVSTKRRTNNGINIKPSLWTRIKGFILWTEEDKLRLEERQNETRKGERFVNGRMTVKGVAILAAQFLPIWMVANYTYNYSLVTTSLSSSSIISTTSSFFTLLICHFLKVERFSIVRALALLFSIAGVTIIGIVDKKVNKESNDSLWGDFWALVSAVVYGGYISFLKIKIKDEKEVKMAMFFGFVGFFCLIVAWPVFIILHFSKIEPFEIPPLKVTGMLLMNGLFATVASEVLWALVIYLTSATVATVGLSLNVPFSIVADLLMGKKVYPAPYYAGACIVVVGFVVATISGS